MSYDLNEPPTGARDAADDLGLTQMAKEGLGYGWQQNFVRSALGRSFNYNQMMETGGTNLINQGMMHSGAFEAVLPSEIAGAGQGIASEAFVNASLQSDQVASKARDTAFRLAMHEDSLQQNYDIAKANLEAQEMNWWDYAVQGAGIAANLVKVGTGTGII